MFSVYVSSLESCTLLTIQRGHRLYKSIFGLGRCTKKPNWTLEELGFVSGLFGELVGDGANVGLKRYSKT